jgi:hypothetical protein
MENVNGDYTQPINDKSFDKLVIRNQIKYLSISEECLTTKRNLILNLQAKGKVKV